MPGLSNPAGSAAGRLAERGVAKLLASPATDVLCGFAAGTPQRAVRLLIKTVCATLALQVGDRLTPVATRSRVGSDRAS